MRGLYLIAWLFILALMLVPARSYWQSRDSNYNINIGGSVPPPPAGYAYILNADDAYILNADGAYIVAKLP